MDRSISARRVATLVGDFDRSPAYAGLADALVAAHRRRPDPGRHPAAQRARADRGARRLPHHGDPRLRDARATPATPRRGRAPAPSRGCRAARARAHDRALLPGAERPRRHRPQLRRALRPARDRGGLRRGGDPAAGVPRRPRLLPRRAARAAGGHRRGVRRPRAADRPRPDHGHARRAGGGRRSWPRRSPAAATGCWSSRRSTPTPPSAIRHRGARLRDDRRSTPTAGTSTPTAATLRQVAPRLAYLIPDFQNPTGLLMTDARAGARTPRDAARAGTVRRRRRGAPGAGARRAADAAAVRGVRARHDHGRQRQQELLGRAAARLGPRAARRRWSGSPGPGSASTSARR